MIKLTGEMSPQCMRQAVSCSAIVFTITSGARSEATDLIATGPSATGMRPAKVSRLEAPTAASFENASYSAKIESSGPCRKDQTCVTEVAVLAKGEYHINSKYPFRFKLEEPPPSGIQYPKPLVGKEDGVVSEHGITLRVPFVPSIAGDNRIAGQLSVSVCTAAHCVTDKQQLDLTVKVE